MSEARRLLPAGLLALALHLIILSWQLNQGQEMHPISQPTKRINVSLGLNEINEPKPSDTRQSPAPPPPTPQDTPVAKPLIKKEIPAPVESKQKEQKEKIAVQKENILPKQKIPPEIVSKPSKAVEHRKRERDVPPVRAASPSESSIQPLVIPKDISRQTPVHQDPRKVSLPPVQKVPQTVPPPKQESIIVKAKPLYRQNSKPKYPSRALRLGWQGVVMLEVEVREDGSTGEVTLHKSSGYKILDKAGLAAVRKWRFVPGTVNKTATTMKVIVPLNFKLNLH